MKLVANKPCNLNGKKYFIGEEVVDYASLVKMGLLSVIHDAVPEDNLEECVAMVGEVSFSIPIVKVTRRLIWTLQSLRCRMQ